jgi:hypothetical protein
MTVITLKPTSPLDNVTRGEREQREKVVENWLTSLPAKRSSSAPPAGGRYSTSGTGSDTGARKSNTRP